MTGGSVNGRARRWAPAGIACALLALTLWASLRIAGDIRGAARIDAAPVTVQAVVARVVQVKGGVKVHLQYTVDGRSYATWDIRQTAGTGVERGTRLCLEAAATDPDTVRRCGQHYPGGDDVFPTMALAALAGGAGLALTTGWIITEARTRRATRP
ncbi:hypothetical protein ABT160_28405 [Streptomyces sp. NPDC001941]|uniref:hypothetical protein n=1 Tax=Streptomyces sp. NPDC001941 TaxID=3154659 RepID=UPI00332DD2DA